MRAESIDTKISLKRASEHRTEKSILRVGSENEPTILCQGLYRVFLSKKQLGIEVVPRIRPVLERNESYFQRRDFFIGGKGEVYKRIRIT